MKKGYILLEILISMVVASILSVGLLATIMQVNDLQQTIVGLTSQYGRVSIFQQQLERDLMGAFIPAQVDMMQTQTGKKEDQKQPLEMVFEGISKGGDKGGRLDYLTFITSNPLEIFFGIKDIKLKPRAARVVYRLIPDTRRKNSYQLLRQEGTAKLSFAQYKEKAEGEMRAYPMIDGIQDLAVQFIKIEEHKDKDGKNLKYVYKKSPVWHSIVKKIEGAAVQKPGARPPQKPRPQLPNWVEFKISLWDQTFKKSREFTFTVPIQVRVGEADLPPKEEEKKEEDAKSTEKKSTAAPTVKKEPVKPGKKS